MSKIYKGINVEDNLAESLQCAKCQTSNFALSWRKFKNGTVHIAVACKDCGAFIKWGKQKIDVNQLGDDK